MSVMEQKMQDQMEAGEREFNDLCERLNPPIDWQDPEWRKYDEFSWRNCASEDLMNEWLNLTGRSRLIIAANLEQIAESRNWD